jgi:hypothetical protein
MPSPFRTANLTPSLLHRDGLLQVVNLTALAHVPARERDDDAAEAAASPRPVRTLFEATSAAIAGKRGPHRGASPESERPVRLSLSLSSERGWKMRLVAAYFRQSCQAFMVEALDQHIARLARDPANYGLQILLNQMHARAE